ncbi:hypothetical protein [Peromfec virus RodF7_9]|uniref:Uncharacterized protein n=1 Tax=Peromfec virus RodF7_9 TaxID=2929356 RepID=A0A976N2D5_9VIRU|nr:hypothetical protein [Peromfec virus RodF7_9]
MFSTLKKTNKTFRTAKCRVSHVQSGLAVTPAQMLHDASLGIPIKSRFDDSSFYDGDSELSVGIDPLERRGVDISDAWNAQQDAKARLQRAQADDIRVYGK